MIDKFMEFCGYITVVGGVLALAYQGFKFITKPHKTVNKRLDNDYKSIQDLREDYNDLKLDITELKDLSKILVRGMYNLFEHLETNNNTGEMHKCKVDLFDKINDSK